MITDKIIFLIPLDDGKRNCHMKPKKVSAKVSLFLIKKIDMDVSDNWTVVKRDKMKPHNDGLLHHHPTNVKVLKVW